MQTVPERRPSSNADISEETAKTEATPVGSDKLQVIPKSRVGARENVLPDRIFKGVVVLCGVTILSIVGLIVFELLRDVSSELHRRGSRAQGYELKGASLLDSRAPSSPDFTRDQALVHQTQPSSTTC